MRVVRGIFGTLLLLAAGFVGGLALMDAGAEDSLSDLRIERLLSGDGLLVSVGCFFLTLCGVACARTGGWRGKLLPLGLLLALPAVVVDAWATRQLNGYGAAKAIPFIAVAVLLAIGASVVLSRGKPPA